MESKQTEMWSWWNDESLAYELLATDHGWSATMLEMLLWTICKRHESSWMWLTRPVPTGTPDEPMPNSIGGYKTSWKWLTLPDPTGTPDGPIPNRIGVNNTNEKV